MKRRFFSMLLLLVTSFVAWGQGYNDVRWPNYTAISGTAGTKTAEDYPKLLDNSTSTKWCVTSLGNPTYIEFDATRPIKPTYYTLTTGNDSQNNSGARNPKSWVIKGSNDKSNWTTLATVSNGEMPAENYASKTFSMGNLGSFYRYWRFEVTSIVSGTVFQLSEFSFLVDFTLLQHVFVEGLEDVYYLSPSQDAINPQLTVRDLKGQTPAQGTYWKIGYYNSNNQYLSSVNSSGDYTLVISKGSINYYSGLFEAPIKVTYGLDGSGTQSDPYTISSISDWNRFVGSLNVGKTYAGQYVSLEKDLDLEINSIILPSIMADAGHAFSGTFMGNNHTITQTASYGEQFTALFREANGATFKDLTVGGSLTTSQKFMGGIVANATGGSTAFDNCHVTATLTTTLNGDATSAGFVAYIGNGHITFTNCSFTGSLIGPNAIAWGGFVGWAEYKPANNAVSTIDFTSCLFAPASLNILVTENDRSCNFVRCRDYTNTPTYGQGCYCLQRIDDIHLDTDQGMLVYAAQQEGINKLVTAADGNSYYMTCTVSGIQSEYTYEGTPILPVPTVTAFDADTATEGSDYTLTYSDPTGRYPGQQSVTITANGSTYAGSTTIAYTVVRDPSLPELQMGDVNVDGFLTISDITTIVNMARGQAATNQWADVDGDGSVTSQDAEIVVAMILGKPYSLTLSSSALTLRGGQTSQLAASFFPDAEYAQGITWTSSDPAVATVDESGLVTAIGSGSCTVAATAYGLTASCTVSIISADDYVDLGLPSGTLWATKNVGASQPKGYGQYFAWGETQPKGTYTSANYTKSGISAITAADDAATVNWGAAWQMPTKAEMEELFNSTYTTQEWTTENGITGVRITSKANGNSIFLPATGYYSDYTYAMNTNYSVYYWTSTRATYSANAYHLYGNKNSTPYVDAGSRYYGYSVRPVLVEKAVRATGITLSEDTLRLFANETIQLRATVLPTGAEQPLTWTSSDPTVATVDAQGVVTTIADGECAITVTTTDGTGLSALCEVAVHSYVDLGLPSGTLWATRNIGAEKPEDYGDYFAWGETKPKETYGWENYIYCNGTYTTLTKYCTEGVYPCGDNGFMDALTELLPEDDAAYVNWGEHWRMPSKAQLEELINPEYTDAVWTTLNGVYGRLITSLIEGYTDRSLFLPASGHHEASLYNTGEFGGNWSRTLSMDYPSYAWKLGFGSGRIYVDDQLVRSKGLSVRPVTVR